jgi:hypothetical protein
MDDMESGEAGGPACRAGGGGLTEPRDDGAMDGLGTDAPRLCPWLKGFAPLHAPVALADVARQGWTLADLPTPLAVVRQAALAHNIRWMQDFATTQGVQMAPHGKTTMSPQLFKRQLNAGAWGLTFANVRAAPAGWPRAAGSSMRPRKVRIRWLSTRRTTPAG